MPTTRPIYFQWSDSRRPPVQDDRDTAARIIRAHRRSALALVRYNRVARSVEVETIGYASIGTFTL